MNIDTIIGFFIGALLAALFGVVFNSIKDWLWNRFSDRRRIRIEIIEEHGPISRQLGFTEKALKVTVTNRGETNIEIEDLRLMLAGSYGVPVLPEAPPGRSHSRLPASLSSGGAESWFYSAEKLASLIAILSSDPKPQGNKVSLVPQVKTSAGKVYKGTAHRFIADVNAHWP